MKRTITVERNWVNPSKQMKKTSPSAKCPFAEPWGCRLESGRAAPSAPQEERRWGTGRPRALCPAGQRVLRGELRVHRELTSAVPRETDKQERHGKQVKAEASYPSPKVSPVLGAGQGERPQGGREEAAGKAHSECKRLLSYTTVLQNQLLDHSAN